MRAIAVCALVSSLSLNAHDAAIPGCAAPNRPADDVPEPVWQAFKADLHAYRECMSQFIRDNHDASDRHRAAANQATEQWNAFVRAELNVPEDFPWPPEDDG